jgi:protein tyrosine phosphatase (PTP) superfamily phosphohydrolase (DUF442 family)
VEINWISDEIAFADQPTFQDLRWLNEGGFRTIVNVRWTREQPAEERPQVVRAGMRYVAIPIAQPAWSEDHFDRLAAALRDADARPALVHSAEGARAGILALTWHAAERGWSERQLEDRARELGLDLPAAARRWLARRSTPAHPPPPS